MKKNKCGVYAIENKINGKKYYGSTIDWTTRRSSHKQALRNNNHKNKHLQRAWNKYGENVFDFIWIQDSSPENRLSLEQLCIDANLNGYNIQPKAGCFGGYWKGKKLSEKHKNNLSAVSKGKIKSKEHRQHISEGRKGIKFSKEHLHNLSISHQRKDTKGYFFVAKNNNFRVRIRNNGKRYSGGCYATELEAKIAVKQLKEKLGVI